MKICSGWFGSRAGRGTTFVARTVVVSADGSVGGGPAVGGSPPYGGGPAFGGSPAMGGGIEFGACPEDEGGPELGAGTDCGPS